MKLTRSSAVAISAFLALPAVAFAQDPFGGGQALAKFARLVKAHEKRIASGLSASEARRLIELLEKVRDKAHA